MVKQGVSWGLVRAGLLPFTVIFTVVKVTTIPVAAVIIDIVIHEMLHHGVHANTPVSISARALGRDTLALLKSL